MTEGGVRGLGIGNWGLGRNIGRGKVEPMVTKLNMAVQVCLTQAGRGRRMGRVDFDRILGERYEKSK